MVHRSLGTCDVTRLFSNADNRMALLFTLSCFLIKQEGPVRDTALPFGQASCPARNVPLPASGPAALRTQEVSDFRRVAESLPQAHRHRVEELQSPCIRLGSRRRYLYPILC